jgi:hypothetical protein
VWPWFVAGAALLIILTALWILLRRKEKVDPSTMMRMAYEQACRDLESANPAHPRDAAVHGSLVLRRYLVVAIGDPSLYETHEEFITRHDALRNLGSEAHNAAVVGFARLATFKYAPEVPQTASAEILSAARELLDTLHHAAA